MGHLLNLYHFCPVCKQPTENLNLCNTCMEDMGFMLRRYEADVREKAEVRKKAVRVSLNRPILETYDRRCRFVFQLSDCS